MSIIKLKRWGSTPHGTFGELTLPSGTTLYTVERPWKDNTPRESCIPSGVYPLGLRDSPLMTKLSKGLHPKAWEVKEVSERSLILIHAANTMDNLEGCIGLGTSLGWIESPRGSGTKWAVGNSTGAINTFMEELSEVEENILIEIYWSLPETEKGP